MKQENTPKVEPKVSDVEVTDISTHEIASTANVSSPGRKVSKCTRTSPSSSENGRKKNRKESTSSAAPETPTNREEETDTTAGDDDSEEQFSQLHPFIVKPSRTSGQLS